MARRSSRYPTELELEVLKVIWRDGPSTVRQVRDALADFRDLAHNSVMTIMTIMADKGYLARKRQGKGYVYSPLVTKEETTGGMMGDLVDRVFNGSAVAAMVNLLKTGDIDEEELAKLQDLIQRKATEDQS
jgi:predicted transcriptional regulator